MDKRKRIAILVGQAEEEYQANFISGFLAQAFARNYDVCVFAMYQRFQETPAREIGESSIFSLVEYEQFDAIVLMSDTIQTPGLTQRIEEADCSFDRTSWIYGNRICNRLEGAQSSRERRLDLLR